MDNHQNIQFSIRDSKQVPRNDIRHIIAMPTHCVTSLAMKVMPRVFPLRYDS
jgi:hypothetical protein